MHSPQTRVTTIELQSYFFFTTSSSKSDEKNKKEAFSFGISAI